MESNNEFTTKNEYYGKAMMLSDDRDLVCCLLHDNSKLVERWFPYSAMKDIITNEIGDDFYIKPEQLFKVLITEGKNSIGYEFFQQQETEEIELLFIVKPIVFN